MVREKAQRKPKKLKPEDYYTNIKHVMIDSPAWRRISGDAIKVYIQMRRVSLGFEDKFYLKYNEIEKAGINRHRIKKIIKELEEFGFIKIIDLGGRFKNSNHWNKSLYAISDRWQLCTNDYTPGAYKDILTAYRSKLSSAETDTTASAETDTSKTAKIGTPSAETDTSKEAVFTS